MTFVSLYFLLFVIITVTVYYLVPINYRWIALLISSIIFYLQGGKLMFAIVMLTTIITYVTAIWIEKADAHNKKKRRFFLSMSLIAIIGFLIFVKMYLYGNWNFPNFVVPVGISYYTFSLVSYLADVYWRKDKAERNFFKLALFVLYFPKILQGPISRHKLLGNQLIEGHRLEYKNITFGIQLIIWGFFKKLVIADRANIFVASVYGNLDTYKNSGAILGVAMMLSAIQLYCDFSGYMDIAAGISETLGITLEKNFNHPFFSESAAEFWRRWHITLGTWFKDYIYMPIVISPRLIKLSGWVRKHMGKRAGKSMMNIVPLSIVWILTGLWHGTGVNYVVWGIYWGAIIIFSDVFSPEIKKLNTFLHINTESPTWKLFRMLRTFGIYCVGKAISAQTSLQDVKVIAKGVLSSVHIWNLFDGTLYKLGLNKVNFNILLVSILFLGFISYRQESGSVREAIAGWNAVPRWLFYSFALIVVLFLGIYGVGYDTSSFAYQFF